MGGNNALQVIKTKQFNGINFDCYAQENDDNDFWATREQIGQLLGYENPRLSIANIHNRNKERLDKFSRVIKMITHEENREVTRDFRIYNFKGLLEICRYSNQPKADAVMDFLWEIADEIRKTGAYVSDKALMNPEFIRQLSARIEALEKDNEAYREYIAKTMPATTVGRLFLGHPKAVDFQEAAHLFQQQGFDIGMKRLYAYERDNKKYLCARKGRQRNRPTHRAIELGLYTYQIGKNGHCVTMIMPKRLWQIAEELMRKDRPLIALIEEDETRELLASGDFIKQLISK